MDRIKETAALVKSLNDLRKHELPDYELIKKVCTYFDLIKSVELSSVDFQFLKFISNVPGIPHYYDLLVDKLDRQILKHKEKKVDRSHGNISR